MQFIFKCECGREHKYNLQMAALGAAVLMLPDPVKRDALWGAGCGVAERSPWWPRLIRRRPVMLNCGLKLVVATHGPLKPEPN